MKRTLYLLIALVFLVSSSKTQQVADKAFAPPISQPMYGTGQGPVVLIDEAHFNFHKVDGRYQPFAALLRRDGYNVRGSKATFTEASLREGKILVIANALAEKNKDEWKLPTPSAFTADEVVTVKEWVRNGGSLFLIVDHMPFPGAAGELAKAFGITIVNGYAYDPNFDGPIVFKLADGSLKTHAILSGRNDSETVDSVATFTGSAFKIDGKADPILILGKDVFAAMTETAGQVTKDTPREPVGGWLQGATLRFGKGRIAIFGEAAMFSAQLSGPNKNPMGMNDPIASKNPQFLLNVMHWLSGKLKD